VTFAIRPTGRYVNELHVDRIDNVRPFKDISPRMGFTVQRGDPGVSPRQATGGLRRRRCRHQPALPRGGLFTAGTSFGRTALERVVVDNRVQFCKTAPPFFLPEFKFSVSYPLPWDLQASAVMQNLPGLPVSASYVATNATIAPTLGRKSGGPHLCGRRAHGAQPAVRGARVPARSTVREDHPTRAGQREAKMFDVYNIFNEDAVGFTNSRYGASWLLPTETMAGGAS